MSKEADVLSYSLPKENTIDCVPTVRVDMYKYFNNKRREWYGEAWELVNWHGIPLWDIPEPQRTDLWRWINQ